MSKPPKAPRDKGWDILSSMTQPNQSELDPTSGKPLATDEEINMILEKLAVNNQSELEQSAKNVHSLPTENTEELKTAITKLLRDYGVCKCGRHTDSTNFAYHICIEQGLRFNILKEVETYSDQAVQAFGEKVLKEKQTEGYPPIDFVPVSVITSLMEGESK